MPELHLEKIARQQRVRLSANVLFGHAAKANLWLQKKLAVLGGQTPTSMLASQNGEELINAILAKIAWGAAA